MALSNWQDIFPLKEFWNAPQFASNPAVRVPWTARSAPPNPKRREGAPPESLAVLGLAGMLRLGSRSPYCFRVTVSGSAPSSLGRAATPCV